MTIEELESALDPLIGLKFKPADYRTHWAGLKDMPVDALRRAVERAVRQCVEFPTPAELRALADASAAPRPTYDQSVELSVPQMIPAPIVGRTFAITREWKYYCDICSDEGWESLWCGAPGPTRKPWQPLEKCGEPCPYPHEWVRRCQCVATNPAIQTRRERDAKFAAQRSERRTA